MRTEQGLLFRRLFRQDEGVYVCRSREHGFSQTLARVSLQVLQGETLGELLAREEGGSEFAAKDRAGYKAGPSCHGHRGPGIPGHSRSWFKDIMQLIGPSNLPHVEEYCERVWCSDKLRRKHKTMMDKYRLAQESARKARSKVSGRGTGPHETSALGSDRRAGARDEKTALPCNIRTQRRRREDCAGDYWSRGVYLTLYLSLQDTHF
ncbi:hypothetical protein COCON_G00143140 [Conger conger]|uniref:Uncharacterized protein n=1 Tax=Conger conger TaxID=82655 RepID=A0A9Q1DBP5_CONCO|nr:hypothetical protein COCON_G00143140 [Conger conger]